MKRILIAFFVLLCTVAQAQYATPAVTATVTGNNGAGATTVATSSRAWTNGSFIKISVTLLSTVITPTCTLTSNTVTPVTSQAGTGVKVWVYYVWNVTGVTATVSCTMTSVKGAIVAREYSGVDALADPLDVMASNAAATANPTCGTTPTTNLTNQLVTADLGIVNNPVITLGAGYSNLSSDQATSSPENAMEDKVVTTIGTQSGAFTASANAYACVTATFHAALTSTPTASTVNFPGTGASDSTTVGCTAGSTVWTNPGNITADDANNASIFTNNTTITSKCLKGTNFGFSIASSGGNSITGVKLEIKHGATSLDGGANDTSVKLTKTGSALVGNDRALPGTWGALPAYVIYGGQNDLWGLTQSTLTDSDVNASTFGAVLVAFADPGTNATTANVNAFRMTIYYTVAVATTPPHRNGIWTKSGRRLTDRHVAWLPDGREVRSQSSSSIGGF